MSGQLRVLDLFSGIGGFSLGLERTGGFKTVAFCEIDPFCRRVLAKHWPDVPIYEDINTLTAKRLATDRIPVDAICGGFPCQDVSLAGARSGLDGERSGLWREYARLLGELRPGFAIVENTPGLLSLGFDIVLGDLASLGYDAEWHCIPAAAVDADHARDRVWIVAYPDGSGSVQADERGRVAREGQVGEDAPYAHGTRLQRGMQAGANGCDARAISSWIGPALDAAPSVPRDHWSRRPVMGGGLHGISDRPHRCYALGNSVVPQIPELIGRAILQARAA